MSTVGYQHVLVLPGGHNVSHRTGIGISALENLVVDLLRPLASLSATYLSRTSRALDHWSYTVVEFRSTSCIVVLCAGLPAGSLFAVRPVSSPYIEDATAATPEERLPVSNRVLL